MCSDVRCFASPSGPPKPPMRTGTGCGTGLLVRPASDSVTSRSRRGASRSARRRASVVPPRMRTRMALSSPIAPAAPRRWLSIVGIGEDGADGLSPVARNLVAGAELVFGGQRHLALAGTLIRGEARAWPSPFEEGVAAVLAARGRSVCVLASGDPFHYGVGAVLARHVAADETVVVPAASAFS